MKYNPLAIATQPAGSLDVADATYLGGEFQVYLAEVPAVKLGTLSMQSSNNGGNTWQPRAGASIAGVGGTGADLAIVAESRLLSAVACTVTFNVTDDLGATTTAAATFTSPVRSAVQSNNFPRGTAVDLTVASGPTRKIAAIAGVASIAGGQAGVVFAVYQLPEFAAYTLVGDTTEKKFNTKSRQAVGIDSGMEADKYVKLGKTQKGALTIDCKLKSLLDQLPRFDGALTTALLIGTKEQVLNQSNYVFVKYIPSVENNLPDGDGEAVSNAAAGKFEDHLFFEAL